MLLCKNFIVEDEKAISGVLSSILEDECKGYDIVVAEDGLEGFKLIEKDDFALVISDIKMPKMAGNELLVKALEIKPDTTFVMISGHADIDTAVKCLKDGAYDFISKPIDINRSITSVRNALDRKVLQHQKNVLLTENKQLKRRITKKYQMIGDSEAFEAHSGND